MGPIDIVILLLAVLLVILALWSHKKRRQNNKGSGGCAEDAGVAPIPAGAAGMTIQRRPDAHSPLIYIVYYFRRVQPSSLCPAGFFCKKQNGSL